MASSDPTTVSNNTSAYVDAFMTRFLAVGGVSGDISQLPPTFWTSEGIKMVNFAGGATITTSAATSSVVFLFDPLTHVRSADYFHVQLIEYDSADAVVAVRSIRVGGKVSDYLAASVTDFRLVVNPSSPADYASGSSAGAKLTTRPANLSTLNVNELARLVDDPTRDIVQSVMPADGGIKVQIVNPQLGSVLSYTDARALSTLVSRRYTTVVGSITPNEPVGSATIDIPGANNLAGNGVYQSTYPDAPQELSDQYHGFRTAGPCLLAYLANFDTPASNHQALYDTNLLTTQPFTSESYAAAVSVAITTHVGRDIHGADVDLLLSLVAIGLDWAGNIVASEIVTRAYNASPPIASGEYVFSLVSRTVPIARIVVLKMHAFSNIAAAVGGMANFPYVRPDYGRIDLTVFSENEGYSSQPMAVVVSAGVNPSAVFNISADVSCATRKREEFSSVSRTLPIDRPIINSALASSLIELATSHVPVAFKNAHAPSVASAAADMHSAGVTRSVVQAMSFKSWGKKLKHVADAGSKMLDSKAGKMLASQVPGGEQLEELNAGYKALGGGAKKRGPKHP
jgi:hypothetical protein